MVEGAIENVSMLLWFSEKSVKAKITILLEEESGVGVLEDKTALTTTTVAPRSLRFRDYQFFVVAN